MLKWLATIGTCLLCAGMMTSQPNAASNGKGQHTKQSQPAIIPAIGQNKQSVSQTDQSKANGSPPTGNTAIDGAKIWWSDSNWWLVIVALCTAGVIGWQSWETRKAARGAIAAAHAALGQIQITKDKERARLTVELHDLELDIVPRAHPLIEVHWSVILFGETNAFVHGAECFAGAEDDKPSEFIRSAWGEMWKLPSIIGPSERKIEGSVPIRPIRNRAIDFNAFSEGIAKKEICVICAGFVEYSDVFGGRWIFRFKRKWQFYGDPNSLLSYRSVSGEWVAYGTAEDNGEYAVPPPMRN